MPEIQKPNPVQALLEQHRPEWLGSLDTTLPRDLSPDLLRCLTYMNDVEDQTPTYLLYSLLNQSVQADVELLGFASTWSLEEWWHGEALGMLRQFFDPHAESRLARRQRLQAEEGRWHVTSKMFGALVLPRLFGTDAMRGVVYVRGYQNEMQTKYGYGELLKRADHPATEAYLPKIIQEEKGHQNAYKRLACELLDGSPRLQRLVRLILNHRMNTIVGEDYRGAESDFVIRTLFGKGRSSSIVEKIDDEFSGLPGMHGLRPMAQRYAMAVAA